MQRRLLVFETRAPALQAVGVLFDQPFDESRVAERHRREDVMARAALEQQIDHRFVALARGPADDVALVHVAGAVHVRAGIEENPDALETPVRRRKMQRRSRCRRRRAAFGSAPCSINSAERVRVADGQMQPAGAAGDALANEAGLVLQQFAQRVDVSGRARPKELRDIRRSPAIDFGLQRSPAREPVLPCDRELGVGELGRRMGRAQQPPAAPSRASSGTRAMRVRGD